MQINNRFIDDLARVASGALGVAAGVRDEVEALLRSRFERYLTDLSLVTRERLAELERRVAALEAARLDEPPVGDGDPSLAP
jgi:BMFP domain-containing protein YqiC